MNLIDILKFIAKKYDTINKLYNIFFFCKMSQNIQIFIFSNEKFTKTDL